MPCFSSTFRSVLLTDSCPSRAKGNEMNTVRASLLVALLCITDSPTTQSTYSLPHLLASGNEGANPNGNLTVLGSTLHRTTLGEPIPEFKSPAIIQPMIPTQRDNDPLMLIPTHWDYNPFILIPTHWDYNPFMLIPTQRDARRDRPDFRVRKNGIVPFDAETAPFSTKYETDPARPIFVVPPSLP
jgi:hypothetical protein